MMLTKDLLPGIRACMKNVLQLTDEEAAGVGLETTPLGVPRWTSLTHVQLILELEHTFGVTFEADEIASMGSVKAIINALEQPKSA
jgi:acyl carrier protein